MTNDISQKDAENTQQETPVLKLRDGFTADSLTNFCRQITTKGAVECQTDNGDELDPFLSHVPLSNICMNNLPKFSAWELRVFLFICWHIHQRKVEPTFEANEKGETVFTLLLSNAELRNSLGFESGDWFNTQIAKACKSLSEYTFFNGHLVAKRTARSRVISVQCTSVLVSHIVEMKGGFTKISFMPTLYLPSEALHLYFECLKFGKFKTFKRPLVPATFIKKYKIQDKKSNNFTRTHLTEMFKRHIHTLNAYSDIIVFITEANDTYCTFKWRYKTNQELALFYDLHVKICQGEWRNALNTHKEVSEKAKRTNRILSFESLQILEYYPNVPEIQNLDKLLSIETTKKNKFQGRPNPFLTQEEQGESTQDVASDRVLPQPLVQNNNPHDDGMADAAALTDQFQRHTPFEHQAHFTPPNNNYPNHQHAINNDTSALMDRYGGDDGTVEVYSEAEDVGTDDFSRGNQQAFDTSYQSNHSSHCIQQQTFNQRQPQPQQTAPTYVGARLDDDDDDYEPPKDTVTYRRNAIKEFLKGFDEEFYLAGVDSASQQAWLDKKAQGFPPDPDWVQKQHALTNNTHTAQANQEQEPVYIGARLDDDDDDYFDDVADDDMGETSMVTTAEAPQDFQETEYNEQFQENLQDASCAQTVHIERTPQGIVEALKGVAKTVDGSGRVQELEVQKAQETQGSVLAHYAALKKAGKFQEAEQLLSEYRKSSGHRVSAKEHTPSPVRPQAQTGENKPKPTPVEKVELPLTDAQKREQQLLKKFYKAAEQFETKEQVLNAVVCLDETSVPKFGSHVDMQSVKADEMQLKEVLDYAYSDIEPEYLEALKQENKVMWLDTRAGFLDGIRADIWRAKLFMENKKQKGESVDAVRIYSSALHSQWGGTDADDVKLFLDEISPSNQIALTPYEQNILEQAWNTLQNKKRQEALAQETASRYEKLCQIADSLSHDQLQDVLQRMLKEKGADFMEKAHQGNNIASVLSGEMQFFDLLKNTMYHSLLPKDIFDI